MGVKVAYPKSAAPEDSYAQSVVNPAGHRIGSSEGDVHVHEQVAYTTTASTVTFEKVPSEGIDIECDTDVYVRFDGEDATADRDSKRLVANVPYTGLGKGATEMSIIADATNGNAHVDYSSEDNS